MKVKLCRPNSNKSLVCPKVKIIKSLEWGKDKFLAVPWLFQDHRPNLEHSHRSKIVIHDWILT